jgi:signal transduction histidine kinase
MNKQNTKFWTLLKNIFAAFKRARGGDMSMQSKLFVFFILFAVTMILAIGVIFLTASQSFIGRGRVEQFAKKEFSLKLQSKSEQCGETVRQLMNLSESLSRSIEYQLLNRQIPASSLAEYPEVLEEIIGNELSRLQLALERTGNTGVFFILDATVNPSLPNAGNSRAGIYIRKAEPTMPGMPEILCFYRGFPSIAYQNGLQLQLKWDMEFDVLDRSFFHLPVEKARASINQGTHLPLSRLYYWSNGSVIPDQDEIALICSIPLLDSNGYVFGVCGFDKSTWNFDSRFRPDNSEYRDIISVFGMMNENLLNVETALFSGTALEINEMFNGGAINMTAGKWRTRTEVYHDRGSPLPNLNLFRQENGKEFIGLYDEIRMYPPDSVFAQQRFVLALLISKKEVETFVQLINLRIIIICAVLFVLSVAASSYISKRYVKPITSTLDDMEQRGIIAQEKINTLENELQQNQIAIMLSQIQPHFLYNSLMVIQQLCKIDPKMAEETVVEFSNYLRGNMDSLTRKEPIPFEQELHHVETYLAIEKKRFGDSLNVEYEINKNDFTLPALTLQAVVENAVRYGVTKKKGGGKVRIKTEEKDGSTKIVVTDDGIGFNPRQKLQDGRSHVGINNVRYRLAAMCAGSIEIQSKLNEGTEVVIIIPHTINGEKQ